MRVLNPRRVNINDKITKLITTDIKTNKPVQRPELLKLLCIFTFIGSGLAIFSNLFIYLSFDEVSTIMQDYELGIPEFEMIMSGGKRFFLTGFILYSVSLAGAIQMWQLRKIGFHLYTVAQIFILALPVVMIQTYQLPILGIIVSGAFIFGYYSNLKYMN